MTKLTKVLLWVVGVLVVVGVGAWAYVTYGNVGADESTSTTVAHVTRTIPVNDSYTFDTKNPISVYFSHKIDNKITKSDVSLSRINNGSGEERTDADFDLSFPKSNILTITPKPELTGGFVYLVSIIPTKSGVDNFQFQFMTKGGQTPFAKIFQNDSYVSIGGDSAVTTGLYTVTLTDSAGKKILYHSSLSTNEYRIDLNKFYNSSAVLMAGKYLSQIHLDSKKYKTDLYTLSYEIKNSTGSSGVKTAKILHMNVVSITMTQDQKTVATEGSGIQGPGSTQLAGKNVEILVTTDDGKTTTTTCTISTSSCSFPANVPSGAKYIEYKGYMRVSDITSETINSNMVNGRVIVFDGIFDLSAIK
jgi:hypothetical protein